MNDTPAATPTDGVQIPTQGSSTAHRLQTGSGELPYRAIADWMVLRKLHHPIAKMFHVAYLADEGSTPRPITFVFNGGPGAASAFLHMGAVGPRRVEFDKQGALPKAPTSIIDNAECWLAFTDLVFVDPVGTGFSRAIAASTKSDREEKADGLVPTESQEFWEVDRDIAALGEFMQQFLSTHHRWQSPVFVAGESYGGFRVAKLARALQETHGVGLSGAMLISPAIEFDGLFGTDYNLTHWIEVFPSAVATAHVHRKTCFAPDRAMHEVVADAIEFAHSDLARWLVMGDALDSAERDRIANRMAELCGLSHDFVARQRGRITSTQFCRELLAEQKRLLGRYDGSVSTADPYPDRETYQGPDPTLVSIDRLFSAGINDHLRSTLRVSTSLDYRLLSMDVFQNWASTDGKHALSGSTGAMDDLRYGMSLNEHMKVFVSHGYFDLITPFFASQRLSQHMQLPNGRGEDLWLRNYPGGHMFYSWDDSRIAFTRDTHAFYQACLSTGAAS